MEIFYEDENRSKISIDILDEFCKTYDTLCHVEATERTLVVDGFYCSVDNPKYVEFFLVRGKTQLYKVRLGEGACLTNLNRASL